MRILYVTPEAPGEKSGGQIAVKQSLDSLSKTNEVVYVGPSAKGLTKWCSEYYTLEKPKLIDKVISILHGQLARYFNSWRKIRKKINWEKFDLVFLEFSSYDFVAIDAKKHNTRLMLRLHNVEYDYAKNELRLKYSLKNILAFLQVRNKERNILKIASSIIALTNEDSKRIKTLYDNQVKEKLISVIPICIEERTRLNYENRVNTKLKLLITGSLWFGPNVEGILWFLKNVYPEVKEHLELYIVGSYPSDELYQAIAEDKRIKIFPNVENTEEYYKSCDAVLIPIFSGAGMKVKVADALSYGALIMLTSEASVGYNLENRVNCLKFETKEQLTDCVNFTINATCQTLYEIESNAYKTFLETYSLKCSTKYYEDVLKALGGS